jgi:hypothetical protein
VARLGWYQVHWLRHSGYGHCASFFLSEKYVYWAFMSGVSRVTLSLLDITLLVLDCPDDMGQDCSSPGVIWEPMCIISENFTKPLGFFLISAFFSPLDLFSLL